ncbi:Uncharacterised protein [uncultured archaeon]|nr:Uncharacterised protein [uncultured archaeon]
MTKRKLNPPSGSQGQLPFESPDEPDLRILPFEQARNLIRQQAVTQSTLPLMRMNPPDIMGVNNLYADFDRYLHLRQKEWFEGPAEFLVRIHLGDEHLILLRHGGEAVTFTRGDETHRIEQGEIIGHLTHKATGRITQQEAEEVSEAIREELGVPSAEAMSRVYDRIRGLVPPRWDTVEARDFRPRENPRVGFLVYTEVDDKVAGMRMVDSLTSAALTEMHDVLGFRYAFAYGRMVGLDGKYQTPAQAARHLNQELMIRDEHGISLYPSVAFHQRAGATVACGMPNCALDDRSINQGFLAWYDLEELKRRGRL